MGITRDEFPSKLLQVFEAKLKEQEKYNVPLHLRDDSIFVLLSDFKVSNWSTNDDMLADRTITFESFKTNEYKDSIPKYSKLFKIPVPNCYKDIPHSDEQIEIFQKELKEFRGRLPEFSNWSDMQVIEFGNDFNEDIVMVSSFQYIDEKVMRDVALAMVLYDTDMSSISSESSWFNDLVIQLLVAMGCMSF